MAKMETGTGLPNLSATVDGFNPECSECQHPAIIEPGGSSFLRELLRMKPRAATCQVRDYEDDPSGLTPVPCGCRNPAHGS